MNRRCWLTCTISAPRGFLTWTCTYHRTRICSGICRIRSWWVIAPTWPWIALLISRSVWWQIASWQDLRCWKGPAMTIMSRHRSACSSLRCRILTWLLTWRSRLTSFSSIPSPMLITDVSPSTEAILKRRPTISDPSDLHACSVYL